MSRKAISKYDSIEKSNAFLFNNSRGVRLSLTFQGELRPACWWADSFDRQTPVGSCLVPPHQRRCRSRLGNQQPRKEGRLRQEEFDENLFLRLRANNREVLRGKIAGINPRSMLLQSAIPKRRKQLFSYRKKGEILYNIVTRTVATFLESL